MLVGLLHLYCSKKAIKLNHKTNSDWHKAIAIRAYIDSPNYCDIFNERTLMFEINVSADKGYAWAFPSKGTLLNIGIGVPVSIFKKDKLDINVLLDNFVSELESRGVIVENIRKQKSYLLPFASSRPKRDKDLNIALAFPASVLISVAIVKLHKSKTQQRTTRDAHEHRELSNHNISASA